MPTPNGHHADTGGRHGPGRSRGPGPRVEPDAYAVLGVSPQASGEALRAAYLAKARALHPDVNPSADAAGAFAAVERAYSLLADPASRRAYDAQRAARVEGGLASRPRGPRPTPEGRVTWTNIGGPGPRADAAAPGGPRAGTDHDDLSAFEEIYRAFFATRGRSGVGPAGRDDAGPARPGEPAGA